MRDIRHEEGHELDEKFQYDMDTRDDSSDQTNNSSRVSCYY